MTVSEAGWGGLRVTTGSQPKIEGTCHLLPLVSRRRPLLGPPLSRHTPALRANLPLQLLQTLLHLRRHLQAEGGGGGG